MTTVTITGWREGLNKVQMNHLLRQYAGCGLGEAKLAVDELLAGQTLRYEFPDVESASTFRRSADAIGAVCCTVRDEPGGDSSPSATME